MDYNKLKQCYDMILNDNLSLKIDSFSVVKTVHDLREFWKPKNVKVILLAESHVYTKDDEWEILLKPDSSLTKNCHNHFVRFVYCLGYGEDHLLSNPVRKNSGTFQYWEIFYSCLNNVRLNNHDFSFILKTGTKDKNIRIRNKIDLLNSLKEHGIWLVDASIVGINNEKKLVNRKKIIELCWNNYIGDLIRSVKPQHIIIIGKTVADVLERNLNGTSIKWTWMFQPQARKPSSVHHAAFDHYFNVCNNCK